MKQVLVYVMAVLGNSLLYYWSGKWEGTEWIFALLTLGVFAGAVQGWKRYGSNGFGLVFLTVFIVIKREFNILFTTTSHCNDSLQFVVRVYSASILSVSSRGGWNILVGSVIQRDYANRIKRYAVVLVCLFFKRNRSHHRISPTI
ncbi:MAG: hypothetical protein ACQEXB_27300 [Bacillota bacterium]